MLLFIINVLNTYNFIGVTTMGITFTGGMNLSGGMSMTTGGGGGSDPYFANVVLLLHGNGTNGGTTFIDSSSYNRTASVISNVTTSSGQTLFGQNTIRSVNGDNATGCELKYASSSAFAGSNNFTLEFWVYVLSQSSQPYFMGKNAGVNFTYVGSPFNTLNETGWGELGTIAVSPNSWNYIAISRNGVGSNNFNYYLNGNRIEQQTVVTGSTANAELGITSVPSRSDLQSFNGYLAEIRYTQGVGRYTTATIPVQSAPWPNN